MYAIFFFFLSTTIYYYNIIIFSIEVYAFKQVSKTPSAHLLYSSENTVSKLFKRLDIYDKCRTATTGKDKKSQLQLESFDNIWICWQRCNLPIRDKVEWRKMIGLFSKQQRKEVGNVIECVRYPNWYSFDLSSAQKLNG